MNFMTTIELRTDNAVEAGQIIKNALEDYKVVHIKNAWHISDLRAHYDRVTDEVGQCLLIGEDFTQGGKQTGEKWIEIRYDHDIPDMSAYRHSKNAQPLHTDESYISNPADIMFFYCINKAPEGGATTFVDGPAVVQYMKENNPALLEELTTTKVTYKKSDEERTEFIISFDENGMPLFNYNYYCISKDESDKNKDLNARFFKFLQDQVAFSYMAKQVSLAPGEAVAWWDHYVLHGRTAFKAEKTNDRFIWKAGIKAV